MINPSKSWDNFVPLILKTKNGDKGSYRKLLIECERRLRPFFKASLPDHIVDDAIQETLISIHKSLFTYDTTRPFGPWILAIARYKLKDQLRIIYKKRDYESLDPLAYERVSFIPKDIKLVLDSLLKNLTHREAKIIYNLKIFKQSVHKISLELNMHPSTVKVTAYRAIEKLKKKYIGG